MCTKGCTEPFVPESRIDMHAVNPMRNHIHSILLVTFILFSHRSTAAEEGARLYVDFSMAQAKKIFQVVSKPEVQADLQLTTNQLAKITACRQQEPKDIPYLTNLLSQSKASKNKEDRKKISNEIWDKLDEYQLNSLFEILSVIQSNRLQQIVWQVDGLKSLKHDHILSAALGLTDEQVGQIRDVFTFYEPILSPLYQRLGRQMIAGLSADETLQGRQEQVQSLIGAVSAIEKERDRDLYRTLTLTQRETWQRLIGRSISLHWEPELF